MASAQKIDSVRVEFSSLAKEEWLRTISSERAIFKEARLGKELQLVFPEVLDVTEFEPFHCVTLACLIQFWVENGCRVSLTFLSEEVRQMLIHDLRFLDYWNEDGVNHVDSASSHVFNLWRIVKEEKDLYAKGVEQYFRKDLFRGKDLSAISISMAEVFHNVFDHAEAGGNAFSFVRYDEQRMVLHIAVCDFGKGIAKSVRDFSPEIRNDKEALSKAIEMDFTVGSEKHNRGKGLDNILSCSSVIRIFCNEALLLKRGDNKKFFDVNFHFHGTLIYLEIDLSAAENEEILDNFEL